MDRKVRTTLTPLESEILNTPLGQAYDRRSESAKTTRDHKCYEMSMFNTDELPLQWKEYYARVAAEQCGGACAKEYAKFIRKEMLTKAWGAAKEMKPVDLFNTHKKLKLLQEATQLYHTATVYGEYYDPTSAWVKKLEHTWEGFVRTLDQSVLKDTVEVLMAGDDFTFVVSDSKREMMSRAAFNYQQHELYGTDDIRCLIRAHELGHPLASEKIKKVLLKRIQNECKQRLMLKEQTPLQFCEDMERYLVQLREWTNIDRDTLFNLEQHVHGVLAKEIPVQIPMQVPLRSIPIGKRKVLVH